MTTSAAQTALPTSVQLRQLGLPGKNCQRALLRYNESSVQRAIRLLREEPSDHEGRDFDGRLSLCPGQEVHWQEQGLQGQGKGQHPHRVRLLHVWWGVDHCQG